MARLVVKIGSSSLTSGSGLDEGRVSAIADVVAAARLRGDEVVLVSSGAVAAGLAPLRLKKRPSDLATQQAAASVGQGALIHRYAAEFARHGLVVGQVLLTAEDLTRHGHYNNALQTFAKLLGLGVVPIVNENDTVATHEIRFGDNDRLAALVAHLVQADHLVLLSDVDGLYTAHPDEPGSRLVTEVRTSEDLLGIDTSRTGQAVGTGGMVTKVEAARIATGAGIEVTLTRADRAAQALAGEPVGTRFFATGKPRKARLLWLAHASATRGALRVDSGAVSALTERQASLLPAGITGVDGEFSAGDPVDILAPDGAVFARGLVSYDSAELPEILGRSTRELAAELGADYEREVVHRDDLMVF